jgi:hypothetical protein
MNGLTRAATVCLAATALGGCGGDGGGDEDTYVRTYESACKTIIDAPKRAQTEAQDIDPTQGQDAAIEEYKQVLTSVFADMEQAFDQLIEAEAPDKWADFQSSMREGGEEARKAFDEVNQRVQEIETPNDLENLGEAFDSFDIETDDLPADLADAAPSCKTLEES